MAPSALDRAIQDRQSISDTIDFLEAEFAKNVATPFDEPAVNHLLAMVKAAQTEVMEIHKKIQLCTPPDMVPHQQEYNKLLSKSIMLLSAYTGLKLKFAPSSSSAHSGTISNPDVRLPRLELPTFDGDLQQWVSFRDIFTTTVHDNKTLSKSQKLTYLKSQLRGEAARQISSMIISDANYDIAWDQLGDRYQNDRELFLAVMRRFHDQPQTQENSSASIRQLVDVSRECIRSLDVLKIPTTQWDSNFFFVIYTKMDPNSKELWEQGLKNSAIPSLKELFEFLEQRARALAASGRPAEPSSQSTHNKTRQSRSGQGSGTTHYTQSATCQVCNQSKHPLFKCSKFLSLTVPARVEILKKVRACFNCLGEGHSKDQCPSTKTCRTCNKQHNTLIHRQRQSESTNANEKTEVTAKTMHTQQSTQSSDKSETFQESLLATALVGAYDHNGQPQKCRAMVDNCSNRHYITEELMRKLLIPHHACHLQVSGLGGESVGTAKGYAWVTISPHYDSTSSMVIKAYIIQKISNKLPLKPFPHAQHSHLQDIRLADPYYHIPSKVDMLLGSEVFYSILGNGKKTGAEEAPIAINTWLGWLVGGGSEERLTTTVFNSIAFPTISLQNGPPVQGSNEVIKYAKQDESLDSLLKKFWEVESMPSHKILSKEEEICEEHFKSTFTRDLKGRFIIRLPFKQPRIELGTSLKMAIQRLQYLEKRLAKQDKYKESYIEFMREYEQLGHMVEVPPPLADSSSLSYIPHHFVLKESSSTTKLRVVFDASAKTSNGVSLNDTLMVGPTIQDNLVDIMMRFRKHEIAFTADIEKMYRQVLVHPDDQNYQRIVWRETEGMPIKHYLLRTVTYGTGPGPFESTRALKEVGFQFESTSPVVANIIKNDFYMDDVMSGAPTEKDAITYQQELINVLKSYGFELRKWTSNSQAVLDSLPPQFRETQSLHLLDLDPTIKALGVYWNPSTDNFVFKITNTFCKSKSQSITKRELLSDIARLFDPVGWLAPVVICAKILMQKVWKEEVGWDEKVPHHIQEQWDNFRRELVMLESLNIPRYYFVGSSTPKAFPSNFNSKYCLVGFCDASELAYASVVYIVRYDDNISFVSLVTSKTRVAPSKKLSLPRLELCSASLLAELMVNVKCALKFQFHSICAFSDSTVALSWIRGHPSKWKTFVANRVTKIQECVPIDQWGHVRGVENPADCASRGIDAQSLINHDLWWNGPSWLREGVPIPTIPQLQPQEVNFEERTTKTICSTTIADEQFQLLYKYSSLHTLLHVTAYLKRFINNVRNKIKLKKLINQAKEQHRPTEEMSGVGLLKSSGCGLDIVGGGLASSAPLVIPLTPTEVNSALTTWVKYTQKIHFVKKKGNLFERKGQTCKDSLLSLDPFEDDEGVIRVGGRLKNAELPVEKKNPMILPRRSHLTKLLIQSVHKDNFHAGPQLVQATIYQRFWITRGRDTIRHELKRCVTCARQAAKVQQQFMADLPLSRVTPARPFETCGVDYAGPFMLKPNLPRSKQTVKGYLAVFVCFVTRSIHLEIVSDQTTQAFQAALRRFVSRRGRPKDIHSDNGTNFVGASRELKEWLTLTKSSDFNNKLANQCVKQGINWHFIPPAAPHFGGLWESGVKSVKYHLKRIVGHERLTYEQLNTIVIQIEACLNSRPLTAASSDPNDLTVLTPGHFLIGAPLTAVPEPDLTTLKTGHLDRWQLLQQMQQHFWKRWSSEFLTRLQQRPKWAGTRSELQVGDLVIIKEENLPPQQWKLGRIKLLHPGKDNIARVATLHTATGELKRPFVKLCLLPILHD